MQSPVLVRAWMEARLRAHITLTQPDVQIHVRTHAPGSSAANFSDSRDNSEPTTSTRAVGDSCSAETTEQNHASVRSLDKFVALPLQAGPCVLFCAVCNEMRVQRHT